MTVCSVFFALMRVFGVAPMVAFGYTLGGGFVVALGMLAMLRRVARSARIDPMSPRIVASVPNDVEAAMIVDVLGDNGIRARVVGSHPSGILGLDLGDVRVVVAQADAERALEILAETDLENDDHVRT
jgi:hypothetical protein